MNNKQNRDLYKLNDLEQFLKQFLEENPYYSLNIIGQKDDSEEGFDDIYEIMRRSWKKRYKNKDFFLETDPYYIREDFFLNPQENVTMRKNLRYMPLLMHSHQFIEVNYVLESAGSMMITRTGMHELNDGDILLCPPNFNHCFKTHNDNCIILDFFIRVTTFDTVFFQLLNKNNYLSVVFSNAVYNAKGSFVLWHCNRDSSIRKLVLDSYQEWKDKPRYSEQMMEANILKFFILLMRKHENEAIFSVPQVNSTNSMFQTFLNYMHLHLKALKLEEN